MSYIQIRNLEELQEWLSKEYESPLDKKNTEPKFDYKAWNKLAEGAAEEHRLKNQGIKESEGKLFYELDWDFITQMAERMESNDKYPVYNWTKDMDIEELKQALFRHVIEVMKGNYEDDGREFGHLEAIATNCMIINCQLKNK